MSAKSAYVDDPWQGLQACLWASAAFVLAAGLLSLLLPSSPAPGAWAASGPGLPQRLKSLRVDADVLGRGTPSRRGA